MSDPIEETTAEIVEPPATDTTATEPAEGTPEAAAAPETPEPVEVEPEEPEGKPGREAAKYRRQLREVEAERDQLAAMLDASRRQAIMNSKSFRFVVDGAQKDAAALADPSKLFDSNGDLDEKAVHAFTRELFKERPYMQYRMIVPGEGGNPDVGKILDNFESAFKPKN